MKQYTRARGGQNGEPGVWPMVWELRFVLIFGYFLSRKSIKFSLPQAKNKLKNNPVNPRIQQKETKY